MAHPAQNISQNDDQTWKLGVFITSLNGSKDVLVRGNTHIGALIIRIVDSIEEIRDWSDHFLWWPERQKWLKNTRPTLDQLGVTTATYLEFKPMRKSSRLDLL